MLSALPAELSARLFAKARPVSLSADETLFLAGDAGDGCYRVDDGLLKASILSPTGGERILAIFGPGAVIGELSMIDGAPRSATVTALRDSQAAIREPRRRSTRSAPTIRTSTSIWSRCSPAGCATPTAR